MNFLNELIIRRGRITLLILLVLIGGISIFSFSFKLYSIDETSLKVEKIERSLQNLRAALHIDSIRQYQIQKIIRIIDQYNPALDASLKYDIANEIYLMSMKYTHIDVDLICATITHESAMTWRPDVKSEAGAMGLMQIMPTTGLILAKYEDITWSSAEEVLCNPIYNIRLGCRYLDALIESYDMDGGLAAYNGGEKRAALWLSKKKDYSYLWEETRGYVPAVLNLYEKFKNEDML